MRSVDLRVLNRLRRAISKLEGAHPLPEEELDASVATKWRDWLGPDLPWAGTSITDDEWFFITTLCGTMTVDGQRTHIRTYLREFKRLAQGDIRFLTPEVVRKWRLRSPWMRDRLTRMGEILKARGQSMSQYTDGLRQLERTASPDDPMPALDHLSRDHHATGHKTLGIFVRECVLGNCFPIDSRVERLLHRFGLPCNERHLVGACLVLGRNSRDIARMFYDAGGVGSFFTEGVSQVDSHARHQCAQDRAVAPVPVGAVDDVLEFTDNDQAYQDWLRTHPRGFVINLYRNMDPRTYSALHRAICPSISKYTRTAQPGGFTERQYVKVCADSIATLREWIRAHGEPSGRFKTECSRCDPNRASVPIPGPRRS